MCSYTLFPIPSFGMFQQMLWVFSDHLVGRFCSYLLPERIFLDACSFKTFSRKISMNDGMGNGVHLLLPTQLEEKSRLERDEERYWREYSKHKRDLLNGEDSYRSLDCRLRYTQARMDL